VLPSRIASGVGRPQAAALWHWRVTGAARSMSYRWVGPPLLCGGSSLAGQIKVTQSSSGEMTGGGCRVTGSRTFCSRW
jgi:hypothetical protein